MTETAKHYPCRYCHRTFSHFKALGGHIHAHTGYHCPTCRKKFPSIFALGRHKGNFHGTMTQTIRRARAVAKRLRAKSSRGIQRLACPACQRTYASRQSLRGHVRYEHGRSLKRLEREFSSLRDDGGASAPLAKRASPGMLLGELPLDWNAMFASFRAQITQEIGTAVRQELRMFVQHVAGQAFQEAPSASPTKKHRKAYVERMRRSSLREGALRAVGFNGTCLKCGQPTSAPKITRKDGQLLTGQRVATYWNDAIKHSRRYTAWCRTCLMKRRKATAA